MHVTTKSQFGLEILKLVFETIYFIPHLHLKVRTNGYCYGYSESQDGTWTMLPENMLKWFYFLIFFLMLPCSSR